MLNMIFSPCSSAKVASWGWHDLSCSIGPILLFAGAFALCQGQSTTKYQSKAVEGNSTSVAK